VDNFTPSPEFIKMLRDQVAEWKTKHYNLEETFITQRETFGAMVADRDAKIAALNAENERLKTVPMKYRRMEFNAQLQNENFSLRTELKKLKSDYHKANAEWQDELDEVIQHNAAIKAELAEAKLEMQKVNDVAFQECMERISATERWKIAVDDCVRFSDELETSKAELAREKEMRNATQLVLEQTENELLKAQPEPVATFRGHFPCGDKVYTCIELHGALPRGAKLYTHPAPADKGAIWNEAIEAAAKCAKNFEPKYREYLVCPTNAILSLKRNAAMKEVIRDRN
jgi:hypothetical protein